MTPREIFLSWAPPESIWSPWAKPVLFTFIKSESSDPSENTLAAQPDLTGIPTPGTGAPKTALIINLQRELSVDVGLELAKIGYRPVPLFNCADGPDAVVPVRKTISRLKSGADVLHGLHLPPDAPPAFLLDSRRVSGVLPPNPGNFDNRWVVFPQDFPSAIFLRSQGIEQVILIQDRSGVEDDLAQVLALWQKGQIEISIKESAGAPVPKTTPLVQPHRFRFWARALLLMTLQGRRSNAGGFGSVIPTPSSGGG